ncbi:MAG: Asp-tRNA(Asn)/Glu-tRNA(Gln) amidotransferase A subunit family amidase [Gammaproteobacteria bacterium]|jgi:Asp-tRNA(Asn)/Glu-tRNA(Gln) amidotransferase A subunit family amidase
MLQKLSLFPTATQIAASIAAGDTTPSQVLHEHFALIDEREHEVHAWTVVDREAALEQAQQLAGASPPQGLMYGVPFGIKDNIDTADLPTEYGSSIHTAHQPGRDATCVAGLRLAGGIAMGKTVCTEFAHRAPRATRNPWNVAHTPGGSSSGSAAAVACGMVPVALGTQTTGSVIRPATYCGVIGYKPTWGEFNISGVLANSPSFDTLGVMARSVEDIVLVRRALLDESIPTLAATPVAGARIGIYRTPFWDQADETTQSLLADASTSLQKAGATIVDFDANDGDALDALDQASVEVSGYEFARTLAHERRVAYDALSDALRDGRMADGLNCDYKEYVAALQKIERARARMDDALSAVDFIITPAAQGAAPKVHAGSTGSAVFNMAWTTLHTPALTLPIASDGQGLPLGLQLVSRRHSDDRLLSFADSVLNHLSR